jgi:serine/threonine-protein kinase
MIAPRPGVVIAGRYSLVRPLARGGMGSVWVAHHRELEVDVTVKFMAPSLVEEADARARFEREAKVAARLRSQHVVSVLDYGVEDGTPFMVMELLRGESLWDRLAREGRLPVPVTARIVVQICKALRTAHEAGLVHRDLKPGNIFLARKDDEEVVIVLDFGVAKSSSVGVASTDTATGVLLGSAHYMSPEQIRDSRNVDARSDLWSLGVILYRMLVGGLPFPGTNLGDVLVRVCTDPRPPLGSVAPDLPAWIEGFLDRALARNPADRFQSAQELAEAFSAGALGARQTPSSRPEPPAPAAPAPAAPAPLAAVSSTQPPSSPAPMPVLNVTIPLGMGMPLPSPPSAKGATVRMDARDVVIVAPPASAASPAPSLTVPLPRPPEQAPPPARSLWPAVVGGVLLAIAATLAILLRPGKVAPAAATTASAAPAPVTASAAPPAAESAPPPAESAPPASASAAPAPDHALPASSSRPAAPTERPPPRPAPARPSRPPQSDPLNRSD